MPELALGDGADVGLRIEHLLLELEGAPAEYQLVRAGAGRLRLGDLLGWGGLSRGRLLRGRGGGRGSLLRRRGLLRGRRLGRLGRRGRLGRLRRRRLLAAGGDEAEGKSAGKPSPGARVAVSLRVSLRQAVYLAAAQDFARELRLLPRAQGDRRRGQTGLAAGAALP